MPPSLFVKELYGHLDYGQRAFWNPSDSDLHR
jgi:hypothetical protein